MERKTLSNQYKQRIITGGIYKITNTGNAMYLLGHAVDLRAKQNSFDFMVSSGSCFDYRLKKDWEVFGAQAFTFETLELLEKKKDQTQEEFISDLQMLEQMWIEKLDPSKRY
jgi:hypothetical protein